MPETRITQPNPAVYIVEVWEHCSCPDCTNAEHGRWRNIGGSVSRKGAEAIAAKWSR